MRSTRRCDVLPSSGILAHLLLTSFFTVVTAVCAQISFPLWFTPVPVTLQVMAVILSGLVLGSRWGAVSQIQYLAIGAMGLPIFTQFKCGPVAFMGPTAGYLISFPLAAFVAGWAFERLDGRRYAAWVGGLCAIVIIYFFGGTWLAALASLSGKPMDATAYSAWVLGIAPFIGVDILKAAAASALVHGGFRGLGLINSTRK